MVTVGGQIAVEKRIGLVELSAKALTDAHVLRGLVHDTLNRADINKPESILQPAPITPNPLDDIYKNLQGIVDTLAVIRKEFGEGIQSKL